MAKVLSLDFEQPQTRQQALREIQSVLDTGGVAAFPTDTFYGLGADPFNEAAVSKIFALKKRAADQPLLVLIHSVTQCRRL
nr:threonylcarbamoyl-AMP synthase [Nitrospinaceae bacterium]NIR53558.1 threonylcarbamoyl-AMP synthase [Nitrospinaceae bacterium]NIS83959.1 threonylcarbamoyl-AMP synthase [Nitrospinaceae bacterium]NIT80768.1 threonylcarbamoyl-AMP synthase [Nitrospinaceae bacterium]NIU43074.1 threonylcarbamoyl-AMP synthase [Nitrospinaceae bacterium]